jgi:hypothetical protein
MQTNNIPSVERAAAQKIADLFAKFVMHGVPQDRTSYGHMGATLTDTVLQAGLNYRSVVLPRVKYVLTQYPHATTTTRFWDLLCEVGPQAILRWSHPEKIDRLTRLIGLLREKGLETESDLASWLRTLAASEQLLAVRGIGPKSVDYLKILVGIPTVAVDRHVKALFTNLDLAYVSYEHCRTVVCQAALILEVEPHVLDGIIWEYVSNPSDKCPS